MGLLSGIARLVLVIVNLIFLLVGLALTALGFVLRYGSHVLGGIIDQAVSEAKESSKGTQIGDLADTDIDFGEIAEGLCIAFIVCGVVILAISLLGCIGACCKVECILWIYAIVVVIFVLAEVVAIGILYGKPEVVKDGLKKNLKKYKGLGGSDVLSFGWTVIMVELKCCGVDGYQDFDGTDWDNTAGGQLAAAGSQLVTPLACCKTIPTTKGAFTCATKIDPVTSNANTGCFKSLWDLTFGRTTLAIGVLVACGLVQILFIVCAIVIVKSEKNKVGPV